MVNTLPDYVTGKIKPVPQSDQEITYAEKLSRDESGLDFTQSAEFLERKIRALNPWPGNGFISRAPELSFGRRCDRDRIWAPSSVFG